MANLKQEMRSLLKRKTSELSFKEKSDQGRRVRNHLLSFLSTISEYYLMGVYAPLNDEVNFFEEDDSLKDRYCFPGFFDNEMSFHHLRFEELIETDSFGVKIRTPKDSDREKSPNLIIVPGLGFTREGRRLGRGKGFYDKYLQAFSGIKCGVCFNHQIVESLPFEDHDISMDYILCANGLFQTKEDSHHKE